MDQPIYEPNPEETIYLNALETTGHKALAALVAGYTTEWARKRAQRHPGFAALEKRAAFVGRARAAGVAHNTIVQCLSSKHETIRLRAARYILDRIDLETGEYRLFGPAAHAAGVGSGELQSQAPALNVFQIKLPEMTAEQLMELVRAARVCQQPAIDVTPKPTNGTERGVGRYFGD